ncbi:hypothetical protein AB0G00_32855 [Nocardia salmonicida]|uniref:hypothetical protein n=1 Tax=Nocardia TaxID=1817 RepID=UPI002658FF51|nr:hypothetical protein [Nocardia sp. PE-7]WKG11746.1 hypothetical protein QX204_09930 [Nocardia sp. PE-7]
MSAPLPPCRPLTTQSGFSSTSRSTTRSLSGASRPWPYAVPVITFDLFDYDEGNYDMLFASKLDLQLAANTSERVDFGGPHRRKPLQNSAVHSAGGRPAGRPPQIGSNPVRSDRGPAAPKMRAGQLAEILSQSMAGQVVLCDLFGAQGGVPEHNVSVEVVKQHKRSSLTTLTAMTKLVRRHLPELGNGAQLFYLISLVSAAALSSYVPPPPSLLAAHTNELHSQRASHGSA